MFLILAVGGLSSFKAWSILTIAKKIQDESHDLKITEDIHTMLHHLIHEVDRAVIQGKLDRGSHQTEVAAQAAKTIGAFLDDHLNDPEPLHERAEEIAAIRALQEFNHRIDAATSRILERVAANRPVLPEDLDVLDVIAHELPVVTQQAANTHQARIRRLIASGVRQLMVILVAYAAFLVVGGGCGAAGIVVFSQTVSLPLRRLASTTLDIASGNFKKRVPISSRDEIGQLSQSFNDMAAQLERREEELRETQVELQRQVEETRALSRIGVEISSMLDIDSILHSVVEKAQALLQCQGAALCLFGSKGEGLGVPVVSGSVEGSRAKPGEGDSRCPIRTASHLRPGSVSCCACITWKEGSPAVCLTAALRRGEDVLGVLCVGRKDPWAFQEEDQELLDGLAAQAAIAIENARLYKEVGSLATVQERERIAREIHDSLAQAVGFLHLRLKTLEDRLGSGGQPPSLAELADMRTVAKRAYEDVRQSIFGLRTVASKERGLIPILTEYLRDFSQQSGIQTDLEDGNPQATRFSPEAEVQLIRVIQEALTNVRKHACARRAWVRFRLAGDMGCVTVADDGIGFQIESISGRDGKRFGLRTMRERTESLGGSLEIRSAPGQGTHVVARFPLSKQGSDL